MQMSIIGFALGVAWLQTQAELPTGGWLAALVAGGFLFLGLGIVLRPRSTRRKALAASLACLAGALALGVAWAGWRAQERLADALPPDREGRDVEVVGFVAEMPQAVEHGLRFAFEVEAARGPVPRQILLGWYDRRAPEGADPPEVHAGERWRLVVRLKRPHGNANPGGFDYEAWLLERNLRATGYVRPSPQNERLETFVATPGTLVERLREHLRGRLETALADGAYPGVIVALAVGDQRAIDPGLWRVFNRTGIQHLMAISGLHVGMVAILTGFLAMAVWRRVPALALRLPAQQVGAVVGWLGALAYGAVAGMGVPTQRTVLMLGVVALAILAGRRAAPGQVLGLTLLAVLLMDPWAVLSAGFWLSFGAVAVLLLAGSGRLGREAGGRAGWKSPLREFWRSQWAVTLGTIPALLALFHQFSLASPLANAVAIPLVSLVITPLVLAYLVIPFPPLLFLADGLLRVLIAGLAWLADQPAALWHQAVPPWPLVAGGVAGCAWALLPAGTPARWVGWAGLVPLLTWAPPRPAPGEWRLTVLDVGQGLAAHVQTASHDLLYDTGPAWSREGNSGVRVVLPYLRGEGVGRVDLLMVSHDDSDHAGGAASVMAEMPVAAWSSSLGEDHLLRAAPIPHRPCAAGQSWEWDGVRFEVLHPRPDLPPGRSDNSRSCVLRVAGPTGSALLMGDLEAPQEGALTAAAGPGSIASDVLVVPHHGSRSSSSPALVAAVAPRLVVYPVGYLNPFHHPHPAVQARWTESGAAAWRTDSGGAIRVTAGVAGVMATPFRDERARYWQGR